MESNKIDEIEEIDDTKHRQDARAKRLRNRRFSPPETLHMYQFPKSKIIRETKRQGSFPSTHTKSLDLNNVKQISYRIYDSSPNLWYNIDRRTSASESSSRRRRIGVDYTPLSDPHIPYPVSSVSSNSMGIKKQRKNKDKISGQLNRGHVNIAFRLVNVRRKSNNFSPMKEERKRKINVFHPLHGIPPNEWDFKNIEI